MGITLSPWMTAFLVLMTGFAGFVDSAAGGGGLISLPAYLFAGLPPHYTYATNKFSAACGTTFATANFFKNGAMNLKVGILAAIGSFAGSALGAHIVLLLSDELLRTMMFLILPVAAVVILWQRDLPDQNRDDGTLNAKKAVLALAIGLGIGGIGVWAALFHVFCHTLVKSSLFLQMAVVRQVYDSYRINRIGDYIHINRVGAVGLLTGMVVLVAFPPSPLFLSELMILKQVITDRNWWLVAGLLLLMCIVIYSFGSRLIRLCYQPNQDSLHPAPARNALSWAAFSLLAAAMVVGIWQPALLQQLIDQIVSL
mgnify:CR=1 FL=1